MTQTVCMLDEKGRIVSINESWIGFNKSDLLGSDFSQYFDEFSRDEFNRVFSEVMQQGEVNSHQGTIQLAEQAPMLWYGRICPKRESGKIVGAIVVGSPVSEVPAAIG